MTQAIAKENGGMKPGVVAPHVRDLSELGGILAGWLAARLPGASDLRLANLSYPLGAGLSHETILFDAHWREGGEPRSRGMVVRIKPSGEGVFRTEFFEEQYRLMELMQGATPVATPLWLERDAELLGAPFFVMEKVHGRVAVSFPPYCQQGWLFDSTSAQRRILWEDSVRALAAIQTVPVARASFLAEPETGTNGFAQEIERWARYVDWVDPRGERTLLREGLERLRAIAPANQAEGIVWGDARLGNMMIGDDYKVAAVMDWEQPSLGGALHDLGWWLHSEVNQTVGRGLAPLEGMGSRDETIALWSETCGKSAADIDWYEAFAAFKMDALGVRMAALGRMPAPFAAIEPGTATRAKMEQLKLA